MTNFNIHIKKNDKIKGKKLEKVINDFLMKVKVLDTIVWLDMDGFGRRGKSTIHLEGLMIYQHVMIETIDEKEKIESLLLSL